MTPIVSQVLPGSLARALGISEVPPGLTKLCRTLTLLVKFSQVPQTLQNGLTGLKEALHLHIALAATVPGQEKETEEPVQDPPAQKAVEDMIQRLYQKLEAHSCQVLSAALQSTSAVTSEQISDVFAVVPPGTKLAVMGKSVKAWLACGREMLLDQCQFSDSPMLEDLLPHVQQYCTVLSFSGAFDSCAKEFGEKLTNYQKRVECAIGKVFGEGSALHKEELDAKEKIQKFRFFSGCHVFL